MEQILQPTSGQSITITVGGSTPPATTTEEVSSPEVTNTEVEKSDLPIDEEQIAKPDDIDKLIPQGDYRTDPLFYEVAEYFGLKEEDYPGAKNKLADIVEFVIRDIESNDIEKVVPRIREIEDSIQSPGWSERRYANFHKYIRLAGKQQTIKKMMKAYEK